MKWLALLISIFLFIFTPSIANDLPALGNSERKAISEANEKKLGASIVAQIRQSKVYLNDAEIESYLNDLAYKLVANSPGGTKEVICFAINDKSLNAFALPGGFIGVHAGLMLKVRSESELASVMAHEIAHITQRHIARMISGQQRSAMTSIAALAVAILAARSNTEFSAAAITAAQAGMIQNRLNFSREYEREADRIGLMILEKSDFDVHAMVGFLKFMQKTLKDSSSKTPSYMRTHPFFYERLSDIQNRLQEEPFRQVPDGLEFRLVRSRLTALQFSPSEAVRSFREIIKNKNYNTEVDAIYGLVFSLYLAGQYDEALEEAKRLVKLNSKNPIILELYGRVLISGGDLERGLFVYESALDDYPKRSPLAYGYAGALLDVGRSDKAVKFLLNLTVDNKTDPKLFELLAKGYSQSGNQLRQHRAQAEAYFLNGRVSSAIEQLKLAKSLGEGNFFEKSSLDARLSELEEIKRELNAK